jgi:hypothetical protein
MEKKIALVLLSLIILWCMLALPYLIPTCQMLFAFLIGNLIIINAMFCREIWRPLGTYLWEEIL